MLKDIDLENRVFNIDHQLLRMLEMKYVIEATKTNAGTGSCPRWRMCPGAVRRLLRTGKN